MENSASLNSVSTASDPTRFVVPREGLLLHLNAPANESICWLRLSLREVATETRHGWISVISLM